MLPLIYEMLVFIRLDLICGRQTAAALIQWTIHGVGNHAAEYMPDACVGH